MGMPGFNKPDREGKIYGFFAQDHPPGRPSDPEL